MNIDLEDISIIEKYWDDYSADFDEEHDTENIQLWSKELVNLIKAGGSDVKKVLDVGTGTGFLALMLAKEGYSVKGIDISIEMMDIGMQKAKERGLNVDFIYSLCEELPFADNEFDALVNARLLWTLTDPVQALKEWKRVVKPGGKIISFMRVMETDGASYYKKEGGALKLPLSNAKREDYIKAYLDAGMVNIDVYEMPEEMSVAVMPHWTAFIGEVPK